ILLPSSSRPDIPRALEAACLAALTRPLEHRTPSAEALAHALDDVLGAVDGAALLAMTLANLGLVPRRQQAPRVRGRGSAAAEATAPRPGARTMPTRPLPGTHDDEVRRLVAAMAKDPSLAAIADLGDRYAALGLRAEASSAIRTAAYHYAHRGLLVQAVCTAHALRPLVDHETFSTELERLARLRDQTAAGLEEALRHVEHCIFADAVADADAGSVDDQTLEPTFVPPKAPLLAMLSTQDFVKLAQLARVERRSAGTHVLVEGQRGDALFAVGRGQLVVHTQRLGTTDADEGERAYLAALGEGDFFGELSFLTRSLRTATVEAASEVVLLQIDRDVVDLLASAEAAFRVHLVDFYKERVAELVLAKNPIIGALPAEVRRGIVSVAEVRKHRRGDVIVREGDAADELFVLLAGEAEVTRSAADYTVFINKLQPGQLFGEMALLGSSVRTATVRAMGNVEVLGVRRQDVEAALATDTRVRDLLEAAMRVRAAESEARLRESVRIFEGV
ncbi:MAG: cyclic nucleotide-binding domain-containing protein, partial [Deltaproteobacteria bacterium]|nr:cyclic nucleotide-binding domain-containing protein [Deltaproteobacteria bacterium]